jgi:hypothetical protein
MVSRPKKSRRPKDAWPLLGEARQLALVQHLAKTQSKVYRNRYPDVLALGAGHRTRAGKVHHGEICLGFLVEAKTPAGAAGAIPRFIKAYATLKGKRRLCLVPTDVEALPKGSPHYTEDLSGGVAVQEVNAQGPRLTGAACCLVQEAGGPRRFLLGCHHVLALSAVNGPNATTQVDVKLVSNNAYIGGLYSFMPLMADGTPCLDAALASVEDPSWLGPDFGQFKVAEVSNGADLPKTGQILTPRLAVPALFVKAWNSHPLDYPFGPVVIEMVYQFEAKTYPGDSGAPVIGEDGTLYGMHFWGTDEPGTSMAIPAFLLFQSGQFQVDIQLVI